MSNHTHITLNNGLTLAVNGLCYDRSALGEVTLAGFDRLTVGNALRFDSLDELMQWTDARAYGAICAGLSVLAERESEEWTCDLVSLRQWMRTQ